MGQRQMRFLDGAFAWDATLYLRRPSLLTWKPRVSKGYFQIAAAFPVLGRMRVYFKSGADTYDGQLVYFSKVIVKSHMDSVFFFFLLQQNYYLESCNLSIYNPTLTIVKPLFLQNSLFLQWLDLHPRVVGTLLGAHWR